MCRAGCRLACKCLVDLALQILQPEPGAQVSDDSEHERATVMTKKLSTGANGQMDSEDAAFVRVVLI